MAHSLATAGATYAGAALTGRRAPAGRVAVRGSSLKVRAADATAEFDPRTFRRELSKSGKYNRKFLKDEESAKKMEDDGIGYSKSESSPPRFPRREPRSIVDAKFPPNPPSDEAPSRPRSDRPRPAHPPRSLPSSAGGLVAKMRESGNVHVDGDVTFKLAEAYGFCWGVERAVQMAYEAKKQFPDANLWITNEIIHNPTVNDRLGEMGVQFIEETAEGKDFSGCKEGEVVILPAFGASVHEMKLLNDKGVNIVDTTCPWVSKVWNAVDAHTRKEFTSIIHGKWAHEETIATASFAKTYLVVKDMKEAQYVCDYVLDGGDREEFLAKFKNAYSEGFDPDTDLGALGIANQTTMLKGETEAIGKLLEKTMMQKHGVDKLNDHYMVMDTICDATQERQDAMYKLVDDKPDMMLVVGGFNSSNTSHLQEISEDASIPSFWVDTHARLDADTNTITHRLAHGELVETKDWLPAGKVTIGHVRRVHPGQGRRGRHRRHHGYQEEDVGGARALTLTREIIFRRWMDGVKGWGGGVDARDGRGSWRGRGFFFVRS